MIACLIYAAARQATRRESEMEQLDREFEVARRIQQATLPQMFPQSTNLQAAAA